MTLKLNDLPLDELIKVKRDIDSVIEAKALAVIRDKSKPISERLEFYKEHAGKLWSNHDVYIPHLPVFRDAYFDSLYDDFYVERHETVDFTDMIESIEDDVDKWGPINEEALEELFASGLTSFVYDW